VESNIKIEISLCNFNELSIKESSYPIEQPLERTAKEKSIYVFPRYTSQVIDY